MLEIASNAKIVGRPRAVRRLMEPLPLGAIPREQVDRMFEDALDRVMANARPLVIRGRGPATGVASAFKFGGGPKGQQVPPMGQPFEISQGPIILASIPEPTMVIPDIVCAGEDASLILQTFINSARYIHWAHVILELMSHQTEARQECLWNDICWGAENTRASKWFGAYTPSRRGRLRNRVESCKQKRYQGGAPLTIWCFTDQTKNWGICEGCKYGAGAYHGTVHHLCFCNANSAGRILYMLHESFHHISPGLLDTHICGETAEPWAWDAVHYADGLTGTKPADDPNDKWNAPAEYLQDCPEQALRNCDSYAHYINYIGKAVDGGTFWPSQCALYFPHSEGGGGGATLDCTPGNPDGMCILSPPEEDW